MAVMALAATLGSCGGPDGGDDRAELEAAVRSYSEAYLGGQAEAAHSLLSARCQTRISLADFRPVVAGGQQAYGTAKLTSLTIDDLAGDLARVTYRYDVAAIDQEREPWVREGGRWHQDDC
jgi:hypothetical protein